MLETRDVTKHPVMHRTVPLQQRIIWPKTSTRAHGEGQGGDAWKAMLSTHHIGLVMNKTDAVRCLCRSCRPVCTAGGIGNRDDMTKQRNKHKIAVCLQEIK